MQKRKFANSLCLGGTFAWALDLGGPGTMSGLAHLDPHAPMKASDPGGTKPTGTKEPTGTRKPTTTTESTATTGSTATTKSTTTTKPTATTEPTITGILPWMTTDDSTPPEPTSADGCELISSIQGVCWKKCDPKTTKPVVDKWKKGDPWCWLKSGKIGAFCDYIEDCPSSFECQPDDWAHGGCYATKPVASGCTPLYGGVLGVGVCWGKCDPKTSKPVREEWKKGDPWCWLQEKTSRAICRKTEDCPLYLDCDGAGCAASK